MPVDAGIGGNFLLVGRIFFGGVLAFMGVSHFLNASEMTAYAKSKGIPAAGFGVFVSGVVLVVGGLGILFGVYPSIAAGMLVVFFVVVTPAMHRFWAVPEEEQQAEVVNFLKNAGLLGASLAFLALGGEAWAYGLNMGL